ncbi:MAG: hypothetical protein WCA81_04875 [Rhizomicrobium sp.]
MLKYMFLCFIAPTLVEPCSANEIWDCTSHIEQLDNGKDVHERYVVENGIVSLFGTDTHYKIFENNATGLVATNFDSYEGYMGPTKVVEIVGIDKMRGTYVKTAVILNTELRGPDTDRGTCRKGVQRK